MSLARSAPQQSSARNRLLAALPAGEFARLEPYPELVQLPLGWAAYESGAAQDHVYFPTSAVVSLLYLLESGASAEIAVVGNDGVVGIALFMGGESTPSRAVVQSAGEGYRLAAGVLKQEFDRGGAFPQSAVGGIAPLAELSRRVRSCA